MSSRTILRKKKIWNKKQNKFFCEICKILKKQWQQINESTKKQYNKKHLKKEFNINDWMLLFIKNLKIKKLSKKLLNRCVDFYQMLKFVDACAYQLTLFINLKIYFVFHVFYLKIYNKK